MAIYYAISLAYQIAMKNQNTPDIEHEPVTILSNSMQALQAIATCEINPDYRLSWPLPNPPKS
jgi:hypothetical protein